MATFSDQEILYLRELTNKNFFAFVKIFGGFSRQGGDISPFVHRQLCDFAQNDSFPRKGIAMPRNLRKTTVFTRWKSIWRIVNDPNERILIGAETKDIAKLSVRWIKNVLAGHQLLRMVHPWLKEIDSRYVSKNTWSDGEIIVPRSKTREYGEPTVSCIGVGGAGQGKHFTRLYLTDIIGDKAQTSSTVMQDTMLWCDNITELLVEPSVTSPNASEIQFDFTHWLVGDAYEYVQDRYPDYQWRIVPALRTNDDTVERARRGKKNIVYVQNPNAVVGETNFPDIVDEDTGQQRFPTEYYLDMMNNPEKSRIFWVQHMNMPSHSSAVGMNTFKYEWIKRYRIDQNEESTYLTCKDNGKKFDIRDIPLYAVIDPGGFSGQGLKQSKSGSSCAFVIAGQVPNGPEKFVVQTWSQSIAQPSILMKAIVDAHRKWRPRQWRLETIAAQEFMYKWIIEEMSKMDPPMRLPLSRVPKDATTMSEDAKNRRIANLILPMSNGDVYLSDNMGTLVSEIVSHPGLRNDLLDCLSWINHLYWSGLAMSPLKDANRDRMSSWLQGRNAITGY